MASATDYDTIWDSALSLSRGGQESETKLSMVIGNLLFKILAEMERDQRFSPPVVAAAVEVAVEWDRVVIDNLPPEGE